MGGNHAVECESPVGCRVMAGRMPRPLRPALVWTAGLMVLAAALALTMQFGWWGKAPAPASSLAAGTTPSPGASPTPSGSPSPSPSSPNPSGMPSRITATTTAGITLVDAKIIPVQLKSDGALEPPFGVVGWYAGRAGPNQAGRGRAFSRGISTRLPWGLTRLPRSSTLVPGTGSRCVTTPGTRCLSR